jgi:hypothetical protein
MREERIGQGKLHKNIVAGGDQIYPSQVGCRISENDSKGFQQLNDRVNDL